MAQITVLSTKTQKKYTLNVNGNTLADLKGACDANGIDYSGMTFFEGRTKTELLANDSQFPDNAVIRLTKSEKKITSGAGIVTRNDAYAAIKINHLQMAVQKKFGKNFTQCKTSELIDFIKKTLKVTPAPKVVSTPSETASVATTNCNCCSDKESWIAAGIKAGFISEAEASQIRNAVKVEDISAEDAAMFGFCK